jgi:hypothetical protein
MFMYILVYLWIIITVSLFPAARNAMYLYMIVCVCFKYWENIDKKVFTFSSIILSFIWFRLL